MRSAGSPSDSFSKLRRAVRNTLIAPILRATGAAIMHQVALQPVDLKSQGYDKLVIHPSNRLKQAFDQVVALTIVYSVIIAPLVVAFEVKPPLALTILIEIVFLADIVLQFFHGHNAFPLAIRCSAYARWHADTGSSPQPFRWICFPSSQISRMSARTHHGVNGSSWSLSVWSVCAGCASVGAACRRHRGGRN